MVSVVTKVTLSSVEVGYVKGIRSLTRTRDMDR